MKRGIEMMECERKLATIRRIDAIGPIDGADAIEVATVGGWKVVVKRGEFTAGDLALYIEIDAWCPTGVAPFLSKCKEPREYSGVKGERLRTIRLRGQISQGLILHYVGDGREGDDLTEALGIQKWELPVSAQLQGMARGNFPHFLRKTDQERIQNIPEVFDSQNLEAEYEATIKLDGSSMTYWVKEGEWGVCSRNLDLKLDQVGNTFVDTAARIFSHQRFDKLRETGNIAIHGELMGQGVQGNREGLSRHEFFVFDIWDIETQSYWTPKAVREWCALYNVPHVPLICIMPLQCFGGSIDDLLVMAGNAMSLNNPVAEGLVFKRVDGKFSFKVISNKFLLAER